MVMFVMTVDELKGLGLPVGDAKLFHQEAANLGSSTPASPAPLASAGASAGSVALVSAVSAYLSARVWDLSAERSNCNTA
jgi:hypothetical protein